MPVSAAYREYALEQMGRVAAVTARPMFGGVGVYGDGLFFALMDDDVTYFKVDDENRPMFEAAGSGPFCPFGADKPMQYYLLPEDLLEDPDRLRPWMEGAMGAARRARTRKAPRGGRGSRGGSAG
ncbi:MAG TPA: TfoX/Sxy family protein [Longimicrobiaceae bacterium]|nr:TfoX/Sxy family protein [Longimicrobiaceae bacterium]